MGGVKIRILSLVHEMCSSSNARRFQLSCLHEVKRRARLVTLIHDYSHLQLKGASSAVAQIRGAVRNIPDVSQVSTYTERSQTSDPSAMSAQQPLRLRAKSGPICCPKGRILDSSSISKYDAQCYALERGKE